MSSATLRIPTGVFEKGIQMKFAKFMSSPFGRGIRIIAGLGLAVWGVTLYAANPAGAVTLIVVGAVVFAAGAANWCLIAPLLGAPVSGNKLKSASHSS